MPSPGKASTLFQLHPRLSIIIIFCSISDHHFVNWHPAQILLMIHLSSSPLPASSSSGMLVNVSCFLIRVSGSLATSCPQLLLLQSPLRIFGSSKAVLFVRLLLGGRVSGCSDFNCSLEWSKVSRKMSLCSKLRDILNSETELFFLYPLLLI